MVKVSVVIAAYNAAETLQRAVACCLAQEGVSVEVVIGNDASTDNTEVIAQDLCAAHPEVRLVNLAENGGPSAARNAAIDIATGEWLAVLDADDTMALDRLKHMVEVGEAEGADAVYDNLLLKSIATPRSPDRPFLNPATFGTAAKWDLPFFISHNQARPRQPSLGYLKPLFRSAFIRAHNLRYAPNLRNGEDFHLMLEALCRDAALHYTPRVMYHYTTGGASISNTLNLGHAASLIQETSDFIAKNSQNLPKGIIATMKVREERLKDFAAAESAMRDLKKKRIGSALSTLGKRPHALFRFSQQMTASLAKRLKSFRYSRPQT